eukprot:2182548-Prymnesium_polylepis.1
MSLRQFTHPSACSTGEPESRLKVGTPTVSSARSNAVGVPCARHEIAFVGPVPSGLAFAVSLDRRSPQWLVLRRSF